MKFVNIKKVLFLFYFYSIIYLSIYNKYCFSFKTESRIKAEIKRENSMMEYLNNFFREDNISQNIYDNTNINNNKDNYNQKILQNEFNSFHRFKSEFNLHNQALKNKNSKYHKESYKNFIIKEAHRLYRNSNIKNSGMKDFVNKKQNNSDSPKYNNKKNSMNLALLEKKMNKNISPKTKIKLTDWFMVSSPVFHNKNKFPPIQVEKDTFIVIETDQDNFRINHGFSYFEGGDKPPTKKFFWFRLSGSNLYYSTSKCDLNILGVISIAHLESISRLREEINDDLQIMCFKVNDNLKEEWKICGNKEESLKKLYCDLSQILQVNEAFCCKKEFQEENYKTVIQPIIIMPKPSRHCNDGWNYAQKGDDWECDCKEGKEQSPIDLPKIEDSIDSPISPLFHYIRVKAKAEENTIEGFIEEGQNLKIKVLGNALRIFHHNFGRVVTIDGSVYKAEEIVIHTPSEHTIDGDIYAVELQVIHYGQSKGDIAKQIILSFLFESVPGEYNKFFDRIDFFDLPNVTNNVKNLYNEIFIPEIFYTTDENEEINHLKKFSFYTYQGSLTFPPCTENTIVYVVSKPIPLSSTTIKLLHEAIRIPEIKDEKENIIVSDQLPENNRNVQNRNGRPVFHFDHEKYCGPNPPKKKVEKGHYEKVKVTKDAYVYLNDNKPSGFPGAYVVSDKEASGEDIKKNILFGF